MTLDNNSNHLSEKFERKLAAIMFTDMVGYSSLSQKNETLALKLLSEHRKILRSLIREHSGREIETAGDSFFVEFFSAIDAATCAIQIQAKLSERNNYVDSDNQILIRIGLHIGDVAHIDDKVHGDGVNIAARLEPIATPGGIALSEDFARVVKNKIKYPVIEKGTVQLKNISSPMNVFCIQLPWLTENSLVVKKDSKKLKNVKSLLILMILAIIILLIVYNFPSPNSDNLLNSRLAVMPFINIGSDSTDQCFADGMTEQIISSLSNLSGLSVIARSSVIRSKNNRENLDELGKDLNVGSILKGSIRKYLNKVRITVQLINVAKKENIWGMYYDRELKDIFMIQAEIARNIAQELQIKIGYAEKERLKLKKLTNADAFNEYLQGRFFLNRRNIDDVKTSIFYFENTIKSDSNFALAYTGLADAYTLIGSAGFGKTAVEEALVKAKQNAVKALELDNNLSESHASLAYIRFRIEWDFEGAEKEFKRAIELSPSNAQAHEWYALYLSLRGRFNEGLERMKIARDLNPLSPSVNNGIGRIYYFLSDYDKAIEQFKNVISTNPGYAESHFSLGLTYFANRETDKAISKLKEAVELSSRKLMILADLAYIYGATGRTDKLYEIKNEFDNRAKTEDVSDFYYTPVYAGLKDYDMFFELAERAYKEHNGFLLYMKANPMFDSVIRNDPRYVSLLKKVGL